MRPSLRTYLMALIAALIAGGGAYALELTSWQAIFFGACLGIATGLLTAEMDWRDYERREANQRQRRGPYQN